ncbi:hypothetical protein [Sphingobium yanoikuyae]|uniref:hypothetical protein n=1 Tax=Sphingobium yanoikuyae TaxID=13690 RepID=UPI003EFE9980
MMGGIPPTEAKALTLYEYQAMLHNWEQAHKTGDEQPEPPSIEETEERRRRLEARGIAVLG